VWSNYWTLANDWKSQPFNVRSIWYLDVFFRSATNVGDCSSHQLDPALPVVGDDVAADVWLAVLTIHDDSVECALFNSVSPHEWHASGLVIVAN